MIFPHYMCIQSPVTVLKIHKKKKSLTLGFIVVTKTHFSGPNIHLKHRLCSSSACLSYCYHS